jgi:hypothetical protein
MRQGVFDMVFSLFFKKKALSDPGWGGSGASIIHYFEGGGQNNFSINLGS